MKLREIIKLPELSGFRLISGEGGLDREVSATEIIDFEFVKGIDFTREEMFYGNSLGISSLMFAKDEPELLIDAVRQMCDMGIACLCYKPIFFKELPSEVISFSEENDFPIFEITDDAFFEDIVMAVKKEVGMDMTETEIEDALEQIIKDELEEDEVRRLRRRIAPGLKKHMQAICFTNEELFGREELKKYMKRLALNDRYSERVAIVKFGKGGLIFLSWNEEEKHPEVLLKDIETALGLPLDKATLGISKVSETEKLFGRSLREAYWSERAAAIENCHSKTCDELGVFRLIAPGMSTGKFVKGAEDFLKPILEPQGIITEDDREHLLETARVYVMNGCDLNIAAEKLFCHKNTVRYRLKRLNKILDPNSSEDDFRETLALAVKILLLKGK